MSKPETPEPDRLSEALKRAADELTPKPIETGAVLAASRRRRAKARGAIAGSATALVAAVVIGGIVWAGIPRLGASTASGAFEAADSSTAEGPTVDGAALEPGAATPGGATGGGLQLAPSEKVNLCGAPIADASTASGLEARIEPPAAPVRDAGAVRVILTNVGDTRLTGVVDATSAMTVADGGVTVWHTNGPRDDSPLPLDLAPGESLELTGRFETSRCEAADELGEAFRPGLPALPAGEYTLSAIVAFTPASDGMLEYLVSEPAPFEVG